VPCSELVVSSPLVVRAIVVTVSKLVVDSVVGVKELTLEVIVLDDSLTEIAILVTSRPCVADVDWRRVKKAGHLSDIFLQDSY
jgi:hypothetical protein